MAGTVIITGANGSLGAAFVQHFLATYPDHTLICTVRNAAKDDQNTTNLKELIFNRPASKAQIEQLDLGSLASVRAFTARISEQVSTGKIPRISAVVCNAFAWSLNGLKLTEDEMETSFQVSHLSHYLLVLRLLGSMDADSGRVVMLGSEAHDPDRPNPLTKLLARFPDNVEELVRPAADEPSQVHDRGFQRYGTSKLANVIFMQDLNKRLQADPNLSKITVTAMDPGGLVDSRAHTEQTPTIRRLFGVANMLMPVLRHLTSAIRTNADAGRDLVELSVGSEFQGKRGYYVGKKPSTPADVSGDVGVQGRLWDACWGWAGMEEGETVLQNARP